MIICCTPLTAIRPAATGWTGPSPTCAAGEQRSIRQGDPAVRRPAGPFRPSAEGDGSAGGGGSPGEIAAQRGAADARLYRQRRFAFRAGAKNTVRFGRHKAARRVYSAQTIERTAHVITLPAPSGAAAPGRRRQRRLYPHRPDAGPCRAIGWMRRKKRIAMYWQDRHGKAWGSLRSLLAGIDGDGRGADGDERRHLR
ncbi:lipoprotein [Klebsiella pneumoniae]|uniref:Lipoprotein n=1 Tax=Klebsiella pneumoniae TaxID=573 RepID=A0A447S2E0_KLEPN|nr:lipoprotein [Klebsiella pneumoniae]